MIFVIDQSGSVVKVFFLDSSFFQKQVGATIHEHEFIHYTRMDGYHVQILWRRRIRASPCCVSS